MTAQPKRRIVWALLGSFAVYLIPLLHVHGGSLFGALIFANLAEGLDRKDPLWIAAELAVAGAYQITAFASLYWFWSRPGLGRGLVVASAATASVILLYWIVFLALPTHFLIEDDLAPENAAWEVECTLEAAQLAAADTGPGPAFAIAGETLLRMSEGLDYRRLGMPGCVVEAMPTPFLSGRAGLQRVAPGGALIYSAYGEDAEGISFFYVGAPGAEPIPLTQPPEGDYGPVLSRDGRQVAWLSRLRAPNRIVLENRVRLQDMASGEAHVITLATPERVRIQLIDVDPPSRTLIATRNSEALWGYDFDGAVKWGPIAVTGFKLLGAQTLRLTADGRVVWDGYRDAGRYRIHWELRDHEGLYEIPLGRNVTDIAVSPDSRLIAASVTTGLNIGSIPDSIFVIDVASGREIYRRYLPSYTRSQLAFLGNDHLAISRIEDGKGWVEVLRTPAAAPR